MFRSFCVAACCCCGPAKNLRSFQLRHEDDHGFPRFRATSYQEKLVPALTWGLIAITGHPAALTVARSEKIFVQLDALRRIRSIDEDACGRGQLLRKAHFLIELRLLSPITESCCSVAPSRSAWGGPEFRDRNRNQDQSDDQQNQSCQR